MSTIATLVVKLLADSADFSGKMKGANSELDKLGGKLTSTGKTMALGLTAPIIGGAVLAVNSASDLSESWNKVNVVFGDSSSMVGDFADSASTNLGMSENAALAAAGTFGNLFTTMGLGQDTAAGMSTDLLSLSADLASFNNLDPTQVLDKLRSGLVGEAEPLRSLGINISQAALENKAFQMGLATTADELTDADKITARYALILEQSKNAQGDFANTSDGLANKTRIVKAQFADTAATLGTSLLPIALKLVTAVQGIVNWFANLSPGAQQVILVVLGLVAAVGPLLIGIGSLISAFTAISAALPAIGTAITAVSGVLTFPLIAVIGAVIAIVALLFLAWKNNWGGIQEKAQAVVEFIKSLISNFLALIQAWWSEHGTSVMTIVSAFMGVIQTVIQTVMNIVKAIIQTVIGVVQGIWDQHGSAIMSIVGRTWEWIKTAFRTATAIIGGIVDAIASAIRGDWEGAGEALKNVAKTAWDFIKTTFRTAKDNLLDIVRSMITSIKERFNISEFLQIGKNIIQGLIDGVNGMAGTLLGAVKGIIQDVLGSIKGLLGIHSPSSVAGYFGRMFNLGFARELSDVDPITRAVETIGRAAMKPLASSLSGAYGGGSSVSHTYQLTGNYKYESEETLSEKLRLLRLMEG